MTKEDDLIERLRDLESLEREDELRIEAADALAKCYEAEAANENASLRAEVERLGKNWFEASMQADALRARVAELEKAIKPFAAVSNWADNCQEADRDVRIGHAEIRATSSASSSLFLIDFKEFIKARSILRKLGGR